MRLLSLKDFMPASHQHSARGGVPKPLAWRPPTCGRSMRKPYRRYEGVTNASRQPGGCKHRSNCRRPPQSISVGGEPAGGEEASPGLLEAFGEVGGDVDGVDGIGAYEGHSGPYRG